ncbi:MAG: vitamin B12-dependent ribonucleotide reductase, partial [Sandaracinaceae bacterium]|nr:vitamin B12-dependent ribonucleotide reductase [Sandaracinaceae bacterium]
MKIETANGKTLRIGGKERAIERAETTQRVGGIDVERHFTRPGEDALESVSYVKRDSVISNPDGSIVFELRGAEVPEHFSQLATDIAVSKYFRRAGIHGDPQKGETSVRQLVHRVASTIREAGEKFGGYFANETAAENFEQELSHLLIHQKAAFNSPVWFNCGLYHRYGIEGSGGNYAWDPEKDAIVQTTNAYERPQCSACFIQAVEDDLMAIYELVKNEARLFKYGSGTGSNFSKIRGKQEKLSGGGTSSGLMSFLEVLDRAAGATKSGGTTRRAAKMVCLDLDHPEIVDFIEWKSREEKKAQALIAAGYSSDFNGEAYHTVSGQNSNNSIRITDEFMRAVEADGEFSTRYRTTGEIADTYKARDLWHKIAQAAWECADPGVQYDTTINDFHTCPNTDRINASNPCSEYMFLDNTACNLASINLTKFLDEEGRFDVEGYRQA